MNSGEATKRRCGEQVRASGRARRCTAQAGGTRRRILIALSVVASTSLVLLLALTAFYATTLHTFQSNSFHAAADEAPFDHYATVAALAASLKTPQLNCYFTDKLSTWQADRLFVGCNHNCITQLLQFVQLVESIAGNHTAQVINYCIDWNNPKRSKVYMEAGQTLNMLQLHAMPWFVKIQIVRSVVAMLKEMLDKHPNMWMVLSVSQLIVQIDHGFVTTKLARPEAVHFRQLPCQDDHVCTYSDPITHVTTKTRCVNRECVGWNQQYLLHQICRLFLSKDLIMKDNPPNLEVSINQLLNICAQSAKSFNDIEQQLQVITDAFASGANLHRQHQLEPEQFTGHEKSNIIGYDMPCENSIVFNQCLVAVFDLRQAEDLCRYAYRKCRAFVAYTRRTWNDLFLVIMKSSAGNIAFSLNTSTYF